MLLDLLLVMHSGIFSHIVTINTLCVSYVNYNTGFGVNKTRSLATSSKSKHILDYDTICLIFGTVLGDGCLFRRKNSSGCELTLTQGEANYSYLLFVWNALHDKGLTSDTVPHLYTRTTGYGEGTFAKFGTRRIPGLNWVYYSFYQTHSCMEYSFHTRTFKLKTTKRVPDNISDYLSPLALAVWFMDDGHKAHNTYIISTQSYSLDGVQLLCKVLFDKYGITAYPKKQREKPQLMLDGSLCYIPQYVLYITTSSAPIFRSLVLPYMVPSMLYKLG